MNTLDFYKCYNNYRLRRIDKALIMEGEDKVLGWMLISILVDGFGNKI